MTALNIVRIAWALIFGCWAARILTWAAQDAIRGRRARRRQRADVRRVRALGRQVFPPNVVIGDPADLIAACDWALWELEARAGEDA